MTGPYGPPSNMPGSWPTRPTPRRIGFVSTRFAGTDGVSLETAKWATVLERLGHTCFYMAGVSDRPPERSRVVPEAFYRHPDIDAINRRAYAMGWASDAPIDQAPATTHDPSQPMPSPGAFYRKRCTAVGFETEEW